MIYHKSFQPRVFLMEGIDFFYHIIQTLCILAKHEKVIPVLSQLIFYLKAQSSHDGDGIVYSVILLSFNPGVETFYSQGDQGDQGDPLLTFSVTLAVFFHFDLCDFLVHLLDLENL